jgi:hypothetical protein
MKYLSAALVLATAVATTVAISPASARHRHHHHAWHHHHHSHIHQADLGISYVHNYGPGTEPGTIAYYDGSLGLRCKQSAAAYRGQDGRAHPCN